MAKTFSKMDDTTEWVAYIAPVFSSLALVHSLPNWLQFIRQGGVLDEVSLSMEELSNPSEMLLHLLSVPIISVTLLASMVLLFTHNSSSNPVTTTTVDWLPPKVASPRSKAVVALARPRLEPTRGPTSMTFDELVKEGAMAEKDLDVRKALHLYQRALGENPSHLRTRLQLCKVKCDLGFLIFDTKHDGPMKQFFTCESQETLEEAAQLVSQALQEAQKLTEENSEDHSAFTLLALCTGRQILLESQSKKKVRLARDMHDAAKRAIDLNPKDDAAHFMLARWHNDIASLPSFLKTLVRFIYGSSLKGTFQNAIESAQTAISLNPTNLVNKVELGRAYTGLGDLDRAKAVYKEVVSMHLEVQDVNSALYRQLAVDDIERMENGVQVGSLARPWWAVGG